ncbi:MAG: PASTA domain-containing protein [Gemmatimonadetes bacterium]|nr:PASTA domain-containing protein [Gemmatimonadota bacterium]
MSARSAGARRWLPYAIAGASGFLVAFAAMAILLLPGGGAAPVSVQVPTVIGLSYTDAERRLASGGLVATLGRERPAADAPKNTVLAQVPAAGEAADRGSAVVLDVSEGVDRVVIPALSGLSRDDATRALTDAGLALGEATEQPSDTARGTVLASSPPVGYTVPRGTRVAVTVSAGPVELSLPDIVGRDLVTARGLLEQLGLQLAPLEYDSTSTLPAGTVVAQTPAAGSTVTASTPITLRIVGRP